MSADRAVLTSLDLEKGTAILEREISLDELFGEDDRWVILEEENGWIGFQRERHGDDVTYYWIDTRRDDWTERLVVGPRSILEVARQRLVHVDPFETIQEGSA